MKKINFISNQDLKTTSGGWSGINFNLYDQLASHLKVNYIGPINPEVDLFQKTESKLFRSLGLRGKFNFFSKNRLKKINREVEMNLEDSDYNFFFGQTPWLECNYNTRYGVYLDADFITYLRIFSKIETFSKRDIQRIAQQEETWLKNASHIFVGSQWAWDEMERYYDLSPAQKQIVYTGGNIQLPSTDQYDHGLDLVFISLNFEKKGGAVCVEVFKKLKKKYPHLTLTIIGQRPPSEVLDLQGVKYAGFLKKTEAKDLEEFSKILSRAFLLIHPTKMDTMGAVLVEAGYFGCPSIAPRSFGIPELVLHDDTGIIVENPFTAEDIIVKIEELINNEDQYMGMRAKVWDHTRAHLTWDAIGSKILNQINLCES